MPEAVPSTNKNTETLVSSLPKAASTLEQRLVWVMLLRATLITVTLGATLVVNYREPEEFFSASTQFLLGVIAGTYLLSIVYAVWFRTGRAVLALARTQLGVDLLLWACMTYATGGVASGFTFLFSLWVVVSAVVLGGRAAYLYAGASAAVLTGLATVMWLGFLEPLPDQLLQELSYKEFVYFLVINLLALTVVAALVNSLVRRLEFTGEGLATERNKRRDLAILHSDVIRSLSVGLITTDRNGAVVSINPAGTEILADDGDEIWGDSLDGWLPQVAEYLRDHGTEDLDDVRGAGEAIRADGEKRHCEYIIAPLMRADNTRQGAIVVFNDVTEVKRLEGELEQARRLAALGELAAGLAHEIRNPLGAISGSFQMLASHPGLGEQDRVLVSIIDRELARIGRLVGDMLEYARPRRATLVPIDIIRLLDEVVQSFKLGSDASELQVNWKGGEPISLNVDGAQIKQVLWNLLRNAAQASEAGGAIDIAVRQNKGSVLIEIADRGKGVAEGDADKIFDPFFSKRERGLGLGLALCKRIVEEHKGEISARPRQGGGTVFEVVLPR